MKLFYPYKITNMISGKVYIGQTVNLKNRWQKHKRESRKEKPELVINQAMKKYGIENFEHQHIGTCISQENTDQTEIDLIIQYDSRSRSFGYNIVQGGKTGGCGKFVFFK